MDAASVSLMSLNIESLEQPTKPQQQSAKTREQDVDRGYAWVVMLAVYITFIFQAAISWITTLLYQSFLIRFEMNATMAGWIVSWIFSIRFLSSPFVGYLFQVFSYRTIAMTGGMLFSLGTLVTGFAYAHALWMLYTGIFLIGLGGNMIIMPSLVILPLYFKRKRGMAMGFIMCGAGTGAIIFPPLAARSFEHFGYTQTMVFVACVTLQIVVSTALYRPQTKDNEPSSHADSSSDKPRWQRIKESCGLNLLARPVVVAFIILVTSLHCMLNVGVIFMSGLAIEQANMTANEIATALSVAAISDFCKLLVGFCFDISKIRPYRMYFFCLICITFGLLAITLTFMTNTVTFTICFALYNFFTMSAHRQYMTMFGDIITLDELPKIIALCRTIMGIVLLFIPSGIGRVKDLWDSFQYGFILLSGCHICIVILYVIVYFCSNRNSYTKQIQTK